MVFGVHCVIVVFANQEVDFVNFKTVQLALREMRLLFLKKQTVLGLCVASAIYVSSLGLLGQRKAWGYWRGYRIGR